MSASLVFPAGASSVPAHTAVGGCLEGDPKAREAASGACVKFSSCASAPAWPWSVEGQLPIGVDVEMGATRGEEEEEEAEKTEGDSEDCVSASYPD